MTPSTFNQMIKTLFRPHQAFMRIVFDDDIIYSKSMEENKVYLQVIFQVLRQNRVFSDQIKSEFFLMEIQYLGHIISQSSIRMDPKILKVITGWPITKNFHKLKSFIGMRA